MRRGGFFRGVGTGAGDGLRTRYLDLGKVALYQVSYSRSARRLDFTRPSLNGLHAAPGVRQGITRWPQRSLKAFTRMADSCRRVRSRRPDKTAARTAATASAS